MPTPLPQERLEKIVGEYLDGQGYELVDLRITGSVGSPVIEIYCDIEGGITSDDCGTLARSLRYKLLTEGYMDNGIGMIVSSPGLDRVIKTERDFARYKGRKVNVWLEEKIGGRGKLSGTLAGYDDGTVYLQETEDGDIALSSGRWKEIRLVPDYTDGFK